MSTSLTEPAAMLAMQYAFSLPADYDMGTVRRRVAERGSAFDDFPGLMQKSFLIAERGQPGAPGNFYAPFYVWRSPGAMLGFLAGEKFRAVTQAFGWPNVQFWTPLAFDFGRVRDINQTSVMPRAATRELINVGANADLADLRSDEILAHETALATPGLYSRVVALNPDRWQLVRFTLWASAPTAPAGDCFEVLHLSQPESR